MSSSYDLTRALRRIEGKLYVVYSKDDRILNNLVRVTGTVDRMTSDGGIAGLQGFRLPASPGPDTERHYAKLENVPWRYDFAGAGYEGGHTDGTRRAFVAAYLGPALLGQHERLVGRHLLEAPPPTSQSDETAKVKGVAGGARLGR
jgi:hypothetical protein